MEQRDIKQEKRARNRKPTPQVEQDVEVLMMIDELKKKGSLSQQVFLKLASEASAILQNEPTVLKLNSPVVIAGDIHGQFYDLLKIFQKAGPVSKTIFLFLGDYVDRGKFCIEVLTLLLKLKRIYPNNIFLLRGNHQSRTMTTFFNFKLQCQKKYNSQVYETIVDLFKTMPLCAVIDGKYFAVHGGISPKLTQMYEIERINRFQEVNQDKPMSDLLWSDPSDGRAEDFVYNKLRNCSYFYSATQSQTFLRNNQLSLIIRGHQVTQKGYKYQFSQNGTPLTLTIFSAPNYCDTYHNSAVIAFIKNSQIDLKTFKESPHPLVLDNYMNVFEFTLPMLTVHTIQIFKYLIKVSQKYAKKRNSIQRREDISTIQNLQSFQTQFSSHSKELLHFLFSHVKKQEEITPPQNDGEFTEEMLLKFLALKASDEAEKLPKIIGPRKILFQKVNLNLKNLKDVDPEDQNIEEK